MYILRGIDKFLIQVFKCQYTYVYARLTNTLIQFSTYNMTKLVTYVKVRAIKLKNKTLFE